MKVLITGIDGYLGWPLAQYLACRGHDVAGADHFFRRRWVNEMKSWSATPIPHMNTRLQAFRKHFGKELRFWKGDLRNYELVDQIFRRFHPDVIVHLGECPSAPYSMIDIDHTIFVQMNNIITTFNLLFAMRDICPKAQLVKLGTMGEYGTPNIDIPEGFFEVVYRGRRDRLPFPRQANSWYHWSKVHTSNNLMYACKIWNLQATDIMQGVVFGTRIDEMGNNDKLLTRLDFDQAFGTVINRFCCQVAIQQPMTPYGTGCQKRGFLPLRDSMQCLTLVIENPPSAGEYRVFNQFHQVYSVSELALKVQNAAADLGLPSRICNLENPRSEQEEHYYQPDHNRLVELGYQPTNNMEAEIRIMIRDLIRYRHRIEAKKKVLIPDIRWNGYRQKMEFFRHVRSCSAS